MSSGPNTARFALPLLAVAQAQKEATHNEALTLIDALLHAVVEAGPQDAPPADPADGQCWLVGAAPLGAWTGRSAQLAIYSSGGWRFAVPRAGMRLHRKSDGACLRFDDGEWRAPPNIALPTGGETVDLQARSTLQSLIQVLQLQGVVLSD